MIVLDAPGLLDDYYVNIMSWGKTNVLAVGLGPTLYLWNSVDQRIHKLFHVREEDNWPTSITWSEEARTLAVGYTCSNLQLWDAESSKLVSSLFLYSFTVSELLEGCFKAFIMYLFTCRLGAFKVIVEG